MTGERTNWPFGFGRGTVVRLFVVAIALLLVSGTGHCAHATVQIQDVGQEVFSYAFGSIELSGITWAGGNTYFAVSDNNTNVYNLTIDVDPNTGAVQSAVVNSGGIQLYTENHVFISGADLEGVALSGTHVYVSSEGSTAIGRHSLATGDRDALINTSTPGLEVYSNIRSNLGWESLTRQSDGSAFWTANEDALTIDGVTQTFAPNSVVRLQKLDANLNPVAQYAYVTDPNGPMPSYTIGGIADLLALDNGDLLALERTLSTATGWRTRIYQVHLAGATDISQATYDSGLVGQSYTPVGKTLLFDKTLNNPYSNFEGITLGPTLADGSRSLLLIADDGGKGSPPGIDQSVYALKLLVPEPASVTIMALMLGMLTQSRRRLSHINILPC